MLIIDDTTPIQSANNYGLIPRDYDRKPFGSLVYASAPFAEGVPQIPQSEWADRMRAMQGRFMRQIYTDAVPDANQNGLSYCWAWSLTQAIEADRAMAGQPHRTLLAESLGRDVNWRNAGNYCGSAIACAAKYGVCDVEFSPARYNLKPSTWKAGWEAEALNHRPLEWWELGTVDMWKETVSALLSGFAVYAGYNWWSHAVLLDELVMQGSEICPSGPNSWGANQRFILKGSKKTPNEAYVVRSGTWSPT